MVGAATEKPLEPKQVRGIARFKLLYTVIRSVYLCVHLSCVCVGCSFSSCLRFCSRIGHAM